MDKINMSDKIESVKRYLDENYASPLTIEQVADKFHISPSNLAHKFKNTVNISFQRYIKFKRLAKSKELLRETKLSIAEIAYACGFGSVSQFNRTFRNIVECSPSQYRAKSKIGCSGEIPSCPEQFSHFREERNTPYFAQVRKRDRQKMRIF